jgi:Lrp/AsnC family leucine-responsive transcriptional regulator
VAMADTEVIDSVDYAIIDLLVQDARRTITEIAEQVSLSPSPVKRRIDRLERLGIIAGYTALIDRNKISHGFEAFVELRFAGDAKVEVITMAATSVEEVLEVFTVAGDPDALVRVRVTSVQHLRDVIDRLRRTGPVIGTKTLMVLGAWRRGE